MRIAPLTKDDSRISELLDIELLAARHGVELILSERSHYISVQWIKRRSGEPGAGADVMRMVCRYADSRGLPIQLSVIDAPSLEDYYRQFGFTGRPDPLFPAEVEMTRAPK